MQDRPTKKIAILGTTPTRMDAPLDDPSWEVWTIGPGGKDSNRWDRLYEIHTTWPENFKGYLNDLSNVKPPQQVVTMKPIAHLMARWAEEHRKDPETYAKEITGDFSAARVIERDAHLEKYGRCFLSSSISWCLADALEEGATDIGLYGIDLESGEEYVSQFVGAKFFMTLAKLAGINVIVPKGCGLLRDPNPYPDRHETDFALQIEKKIAHGNAMLPQMKAQFEGITADMHRWEGKIMAYQDLGNAEKAQDADRNRAELAGKIGQLMAHINHLDGELSAMSFVRRQWVIGIRDPQ